MDPPPAVSNHVRCGWGTRTRPRRGTGVSYVILEVDKNADGVADCYLRSSVAGVNTNTAGQGLGWRYRACWRATSGTSCAGPNSTTAWVTASP